MQTETKISLFDLEVGTKIFINIRNHYCSIKKGTSNIISEYESKLEVMKTSSKKFKKRKNILRNFNDLNKKIIVICSRQNKNKDINLEHLAMSKNWNDMFFADFTEQKNLRKFEKICKDFLFANLGDFKNLNLSYGFYDSLTEAYKKRDEFQDYIFAVAFQNNKYEILKDLDNELS